MQNRIILGRHQDTGSWVHHLDPRSKVTAMLPSGLDIAAEMFESGGRKVMLLAALVEREAILNAITIWVLNVLHRSSYRDLPNAIREAHLDHSSIHSDAAIVLQQELVRLRRKGWIDLLTPSEKEVMRLLSYGNNRIGIAAKLNTGYRQGAHSKYSDA